jgi:GNAT superfamily N-acetyltransferase
MSFETTRLPDAYTFAELGGIAYPEYAAVYRHGAGWEPPTAQAWEAQQRQGSIILGVRHTDTDELVGVGSLQAFGSRMFLNNLVVADSHRHRGIGRSLIDARVAMADHMGIETIRTSLSILNSARTYYAELGFEPEVCSSYHVRHRQMEIPTATQIIDDAR